VLYRSAAGLANVVVVSLTAALSRNKSREPTADRRVIMSTTVWPWCKKRYTSSICSAFPRFEQGQGRHGDHRDWHAAWARRCAGREGAVTLCTSAKGAWSSGGAKQPTDGCRLSEECAEIGSTLDTLVSSDRPSVRL
jgi:hypothetical protein